MKSQTGPLEELEKKLVLVKDRVRGVAEHLYNGMYLYGRPGTSKSFTVLSTLEELNVAHVLQKAHLTPPGLFHMIQDNPQSVIVLDDLGDILTKPIGLQILLAALGNPHDGSRTRVVPYRTAKDDEVVMFTGGIILISNLSLRDHNSKGLNALGDRVHVLEYEPTDEQIKAKIHDIAQSGQNKAPAPEASMVADFLLDECQSFGVRPSVRLYVDKALPDYRQWREGKSQSHWKDLIRSAVQESAIVPVHPLQDMSRKQLIQGEQKLVLKIHDECEQPIRLQEWIKQTGKGKSAYYRRISELKEQGLLR